MAVHLTRFDAADHLLTEDDMAAYLAECAESDDPRLVAHALGAIARARNLSQLARETGMTRAGLSRALAYDGNPSYATISKVAKALGLKISVRLAKASTRKTPNRSRRTRRIAAPTGVKSRKVAS
jgi:probable addiction module antidote protein